MNKILTIVVPYYSESAEEIFPLLSSINNQVGIDFSCLEVVLVNDGSDNKISGDFLEIFEEIDVSILYMEENKGPGAARQYGLDNVSGDYVLFCDADDILHSVGVISSFLEEIEQNRPDIIITPWIEELRDHETGQYVYINHEDEATWMHGKVFQKAFIDHHNIRFHNELRVHEDSYFLSVAFELTDNIRKIPAVSYVWKWRGNSITRNNGSEYTYTSIPVFNRAVSESFKEIERRGLTDRLKYKVVQIAAYTYFCLHQEQWLRSEAIEYRKKAEESFLDCFEAFKPYFLKAEEEFIREVYNEEREKSFRNGIEVETFGMWLERIGFI